MMLSLKAISSYSTKTASLVSFYPLKHTGTMLDCKKAVKGDTAGKEAIHSTVILAGIDTKANHSATILAEIGTKAIHSAAILAGIGTKAIHSATILAGIDTKATFLIAY